MTFSQKNKKTYKDTSMAILTLYAKKKITYKDTAMAIKDKAK